MPRRHRWFALDVDGEPFRVKGDPLMDARTRDALAALARAIRTQYQESSMDAPINTPAGPAPELSESDRQYLDTAFTYHPPVGDQRDRYAVIRSVARIAAESILRQCPPSRERSLALTKLEEAVMWANASVARNGGRS